MKELIELNRYLHDFTSAMWVCGSILIWLLSREAQRSGASTDTVAALLRIAGRLSHLTVASLIVTLASGAVRAATFAGYEHVGEITSRMIGMMIIKHVVFAAFVVWGIGVHCRARALRRRTSATRRGEGLNS